MGCVQGKSKQRTQEEGPVLQTQRARGASGHEERTWRLLALSISSSQSTVTCLDSIPPSLCRKTSMLPSDADASSLRSLSIRPGLTSTFSPPSDLTADADRVVPPYSSRPNPHCHQNNSSLPSRSHQEASVRGIPSSTEPSTLSTSSSSSSTARSK
jgi:hypothetical protein